MDRNRHAGGGPDAADPGRSCQHTMTESAITLPQLVGALVFAARRPLTTRAIRRLVEETAQDGSETSALFQGLKDQDIAAALAMVQQSCQAGGLGFELVETADGFRFQSDP